MPTPGSVETPKGGRALDVVSKWFKGEQAPCPDESPRLFLPLQMQPLPQNGAQSLIGNASSGPVHPENALGLLPEIARATQWNTQLILEERSLAAERIKSHEEKILRFMDRLEQDVTKSFQERGNEQAGLLAKQRQAFETILDEHSGQTQKLMQHELRSLRVSTTQNFQRVFDYFENGLVHSRQAPQIASSNVGEQSPPKLAMLERSLTDLLKNKTVSPVSASPCMTPIPQHLAFHQGPKKTVEDETIEELFDETGEAADDGLAWDQKNSTDTRKSGLSLIGNIFGIEAERKAVVEQVKNMSEIKNVCDGRIMLKGALDFFGFGGLKPITTKGLIERASRPECVKFVDGPIFTSVSCIVIIVNAWWIGFVTDADVRARMMTPPEDSAPIYRIVARLFSLYFLFELLIRMIALRRLFFVRSDRNWNIFDTFIVASAIIEETIEFANIGFLRILRVLRLIRVIRILRVLSFFQGLQMMIATVLSCGQVLVWTIISIGFLIYIFSILLLQGAYSFLDKDDRSGWNTLNEHYGSVDESMYMLLAGISGGIPWIELAEDLARIHWVLRPLYAIFTILVVFGFLNVVTGVFVNKALDINQKDGNLAIQRELETTNAFVRDLAGLMSEYEEVPSNTQLNWTQFEMFVSRVDTQMLLQTHGIDVAGAKELFKILAHHQKDAVGIEDFCFGCQRMKGASKAMDVILLFEEVVRLGTILRENRDRYNAMVRDVQKWQGRCMVVFENMYELFDAKLDKFVHDTQTALG